MEGALYIILCVLLINSCAATSDSDELSPEEAVKRLRVLIVKDEVDSDKDGFVNDEELTKWVREVFRKYSLDRIDEDVEEIDTNHDGKITWDEYRNKLYVPKQTDAEKFEEALRPEKRRFAMADKDKDEALSKEEYVHYVQPESSSTEMRDMFVSDVIEGRDQNKDGIISLEEFLGDYKLPDDSVSVERNKKKFHQYDKNNDGKFDKDEAKLWVHSLSDHMKAQVEARHLLSTADDNKDGKLSEEEIANNYKTFVDSKATDYGENLPALPNREEL